MLQRLMFTLGTVLVLSTTASAQISLDSIDTFDSDNEGWRVGDAGTAPTFNGDNSFDGQPGFLRHFSDGGGPNGKWLMLSQEFDWTGDYVDASVTGISLWADGRTGVDLPFWLGFNGPGGWFFTAAQTITTEDDWERFVFDVSPESLSHLAASGGTGNAVDTMSEVSRFEIFAGPGPVSFGVNGNLLRAGESNNVVWLDNIAAIPEPSTALLGGLAMTLLLGRNRSRSHD